MVSWTRFASRERRSSGEGQLHRQPRGFRRATRRSAASPGQSRSTSTRRRSRTRRDAAPERCVALAWQKDQISSHSTDVEAGCGWSGPGYSAHAAAEVPQQLHDRVLREPVMRLVERIELPSTSSGMICARSDRLNLFILMMLEDCDNSVSRSQALPSSVTLYSVPNRTEVLKCRRRHTIPTSSESCFCISQNGRRVTRSSERRSSTSCCSTRTSSLTENSASRSLGARYQKLEFGPAAIPLLPVQQELISDGELVVRRAMLGGWTQKKPIALRGANLSRFSGEEIALVDRVLDAFWHYGAVQVSDLSHEIPAWQVAAYKEEIPYETAFVESIELVRPLG